MEKEKIKAKASVNHYIMSQCLAHQYVKYLMLGTDRMVGTWQRLIQLTLYDTQCTAQETAIIHFLLTIAIYILIPKSYISVRRLSISSNHKIQFPLLVLVSKHKIQNWCFSYYFLLTNFFSRGLKYLDELIHSMHITYFL